MSTSHARLYCRRWIWLVLALAAQIPHPGVGVLPGCGTKAPYLTITPPNAVQGRIVRQDGQVIRWGVDFGTSQVQYGYRLTAGTIFEEWPNDDYLGKQYAKHGKMYCTVSEK